MLLQVTHNSVACCKMTVEVNRGPMADIMDISCLTVQKYFLLYTLIATTLQFYTSVNIVIYKTQSTFIFSRL